MEATVPLGSPVNTVNHVATYHWTPTTTGGHHISARVGTDCVSPGFVLVTVNTAPSQAGFGSTGMIAIVGLAIGILYLKMKKH